MDLNCAIDCASGVYAVPDGTRNSLFPFPALPCRATDCSVPTGLGPPGWTAQDAVLDENSSDEESPRDDWKSLGGNPRALRCRTSAIENSRSAARIKDYIS